MVGCGALCERASEIFSHSGFSNIFGMLRYGCCFPFILVRNSSGAEVGV